MADNFPSNAHSARRERFEREKNRNEEAPEPPKVVVKGKVVRRKKTLGARFKEAFFGGDTQGVLGYILFDIAIPAGKELLLQIANDGLEKALYQGRERPARSRSNYRIPIRTDYGGFSRSDRDRGRREMSRRSRENHDFDDIVLDTRDEADNALDAMDDRIARYKSASVADLYSFLGITPDFTDEKWGWTEDTFRRAKTVQVRDGYLLHLPPPEPLD